MADRKIIAVVGATGAQGGGLVRAILDDPKGEFVARALTRDVNSDKAKALKARGVEVVHADLDDEESMKRAFAGAYGAFCVTFFWHHASPEKELAEAGNMARAAKRANLKHVIWSTLEDVRKFVPLDDDRLPTLQGKYKVPHFDGKGEANAFFTREGVPTTFLMASFYWENFIYFGSGPRKTESGALEIAMPMGKAKLAGIAAEDIGRCALGIFKNPKEWTGKTVGIAGDAFTVDEIAQKLSKALDRDVRYRDVDPNEYRNYGFPHADDVGNMFQFYRDFEDYLADARSTRIARQLNPKLQSFDEWLERHKTEIPIG